MLNKIKSNTFLKSILILLFGGVFSKLLGFILKIIITRKLGTEGMGLYSMLIPSMSIISTISVLSYPSSISSIVSKNKYDNTTLFFSVYVVSLIINVFFIIIVLIISNYLPEYLGNIELKLPIIFIGLSIPFVSTSSIIKGYFLGIQHIFPYMLSNSVEQIFRFIFISFFIDYFINISLIYGICFIFSVNMICEVISQIVMILFIHKRKRKLTFNINAVKDVIKQCINSTNSKLIGSFAYFLEPIILTNTLLSVGYTSSYITYEYGIINAYSMSLLLMPNFLIQNISTSLVSEVSLYYNKKDIYMCKKRINQIALTSMFIGLLFTIIIFIFPKFFLNLLYNTNEGVEYIRLLSPFTILFYLESPLINSLYAINKTSSLIKITIFVSIIRLILIYVLALYIGIYSLIVTIIINLILSVYLYYNALKKELVF